MASNLTPHWGVIVFLTAVYVISFLLHLDPNIADAGGATIVSITLPAIGVFIAGIGLALVGGAIVNSFLGRWFGISAIFGLAFLATALTDTWAIFGFLISVVTFGGFGLPDWIQFALAIPCLMLLTWSILAFVSAGLEVGKGIFGADET